MDLRVITEAGRELRARNQRITVRAVHALMGGSFRDLAKLLRDAAEFLGDDEVAGLAADVSEPAPQPGQLAIAREAVEAAAVGVGEAQNMLDAAQDRLRTLQRQCPPSATDPYQVQDVVNAQLQHEAEALTVQREIQALQAILDTRRAEQGALRADYRQLQERATQLRQHVPSLQRQLTHARQELTTRQRDAQHQIAMAQRQVEASEQMLATAARELAALIGNG